MKHPKVVERKLGRESALGQAFVEDRIIEIDPRQNAKEYLDSLIHEWWHVEFQKATERQVASKSKKLASFLWKNGVRIIKK